MDTERLINVNGLVVVVAPLGAAITEVHVPDRHGRMADVVHGFDRAEDYAATRAYVGAAIGRVANRIAGARLDLDGTIYPLVMNDPATGSHLHGGATGWDKVRWTLARRDTDAGPAAELTHVSSDGEEGYPGAVTAAIQVTLTDDDQLRIDMRATTDRTTVVSMAHHGYWNLAGTGSGSIDDHELTIFGSRYTPGRPPTTDRAPPVAGTPFDFTSPRPIGASQHGAGDDPPGYDHAFLIDGEPHQLRPFARAVDPGSGRVMTLAADQPSMQLYTAGALDGSTGGKGARHTRHSAFCLESQAVPNAIHIPAWRDDVILRPGQIYRHRMVFQFSAK